MKYLFLILFFVAVLIGCNNNIEKQHVSYCSKFIFRDKYQLGKDLEYDASDRQGFYPIYYVGQDADSIIIPAEAMFKYDTSKNEIFEATDYVSSDKDLEIIIHNNCSTNFFRVDAPSKDDSNVGPINAYPILVINHSNKVINVGIFNSFCYMVKQAMNHTGEWVDIEIETHYGCGTGAKKINMQPQELLVCKYLKYAGDTITNCRVKAQFGNVIIYSNVIKDKVFKKQFTDRLKAYYE